ncbi:MAG TPA: S-adenosylmethionine decarboxylase [Oligoflexia bacterium]|nr:S-adenosylmethionine decarboxylase [Oligoflexia bacterium]
MNTFGKHLILDIWLQDKITAFTVDSILDLVRSQFTVVAETNHPFEPQGLTHVCILAESHFTIHTYPEHQYLSMDLYICNDGFDLGVFEKTILALFKINRYRSETILRGRGAAQRLPDFSEQRVEEWK